MCYLPFNVERLSMKKKTKNFICLEDIQYSHIYSENIFVRLTETNNLLRIFRNANFNYWNREFWINWAWIYLFFPEVLHILTTVPDMLPWIWERYFWFHYWYIIFSLDLFDISRTYIFLCLAKKDCTNLWKIRILCYFIFQLKIF